MTGKTALKGGLKGPFQSGSNTYNRMGDHGGDLNEYVVDLVGIRPPFLGLQDFSISHVGRYSV